MRAALTLWPLTAHVWLGLRPPFCLVVFCLRAAGVPVHLPELRRVYDEVF